MKAREWIAQFQPDTGTNSGPSGLSGLLPPMDAHSLIAMVIWSAIGSGILTYGWKQKAPVALAAGVLMLGSTYFIASALWLSVVGVGLLAGMYWCKKQGYWF